MNKTSLTIMALLLAAAAACGRKSEAPAAASEPAGTTQTSAAAPSSEARSAVEPEPGVKPYANSVGRYAEVFNDSNYVHYEVAEKLGIDPLEKPYQVMRSRRPIVKVESGRYYKVDSLTHSFPFLVPEAVTLLDEIGRAFNDTLYKRGGDPSHRIIVTSLLRTPHSVKKLRKVNKNAVDSSTHVFGTTFDISWSNFDCPDSVKPVNFDILKGILAEVLLEKRNAGRCYVKYEQKSPCFHITVRQ